jgi:hypothetical protein
MSNDALAARVPRDLTGSESFDVEGNSSHDVGDDQKRGECTHGPSILVGERLWQLGIELGYRRRPRASR